MELTKRQQEIFDFIKRYSAKYGYPPTVRDIGKAVGLASSSTVHAHLANLERIGLLRRDPSKPRAIELLDRAAAGDRSRRGSRFWPRRTSRTTCRRRRWRVGRKGTTSSACEANR
jgi:SOS-response transcriptional repressor LexA